MSAWLLTHTDWAPSLDAASWIIFQPDVIIDARLGSLWILKLDLRPLVHNMRDRAALVDFLLRRENSKAIVLQVIREGGSTRGEPRQCIVRLLAFGELGSDWASSVVPCDVCFFSSMVSLEEKND